MSEQQGYLAHILGSRVASSGYKGVDGEIIGDKWTQERGQAKRQSWVSTHQWSVSVLESFVHQTEELLFTVSTSFAIQDCLDLRHL